MKTTYIIGAGASKEANLPTGEELKKTISGLLDIKANDFGSQYSGDNDIWLALMEYYRQNNGINPSHNYQLQQACWKIRDALPLAISIDNLIDSLRDDEEIVFCGKLAIVKAILEAEKHSILYCDEPENNPKIGYEDLTTTWYVKLFNQLAENCDKNQIRGRIQSIAMIIFNYDRCVEQHLYNALQTHYIMDHSEAVSIVNEIKIYHPYGSVGSLPWSNGDVKIAFGGKLSPPQLIDSVTSIKTFTEGTDLEESQIKAIRKVVNEADRLVFLGFAFHNLNMKLLSSANSQVKRQRKINCYATTLGISDSDKTVIRGQIDKLNGHKKVIEMENKTCGDFFDHFRKSLSFSSYE